MNKEFIEKTIQEYYVNQPISERRVKIFTGAGGMDLIEERFEQSVGLYRIYLGRQIPRFLRVLKFKIFKNRRGRYYKLLDKKDGKMVQDTGRRVGKCS